KNIDKDVYGDDLDKIINTQRFVPDKGFSGAEGSSRGSGPVQQLVPIDALWERKFLFIAISKAKRRYQSVIKG
ncbi:hypothetical protein TELCIR_23887, partial [Teladorsagia circumcincta]